MNFLNDYRALSFVGMILISITPFLLKFAFSKIPVVPAMMISTGFTFLVWTLICFIKGINFIPYLTLEKELIALYAVGILWAVALFVYFSAMSIGPLSVVAPIWSLQTVIIVFGGMVILGEPITLYRIMAAVLAFGAIWCATRPV